jgi:hypothetical protein
MRDHTKLRAFELADEVVLLIYRATVGFPNPLSKRLGYFDGYDISACESKIVETEKVLGALLRSMRKP